jgi:cell division septation protein DedD
VENPPGTPAATGSGPAPATGGAAPEQPLDEPKRFYVRAGAFVKSEDAEEFAATLRSRGLVAAFTQSEMTEGGQRRFVVLLGPYVDRDSAALTVTALRNESVSNVTIISQP